jgi:hypothetical protein
MCENPGEGMTTREGRQQRPSQGNRVWADVFRVVFFTVRPQSVYANGRRPATSVVPSDTGRHGVRCGVTTGCANWPNVAPVGTIRRQTSQGNAGRREFDQLVATARPSWSLRRSHDCMRYKHDRTAGIPVSERGLVPRENTAFLAAVRDSGSVAVRGGRDA